MDQANRIRAAVLAMEDDGERVYDDVGVTVYEIGRDDSIWRVAEGDVGIDTFHLSIDADMTSCQGTEPGEAAEISECVMSGLLTPGTFHAEVVAVQSLEERFGGELPIPDERATIDAVEWVCGRHVATSSPLTRAFPGDDAGRIASYAMRSACASIVGELASYAPESEAPWASPLSSGLGFSVPDDTSRVSALYTLCPRRCAYGALHGIGGLGDLVLSLAYAMPDGLPAPDDALCLARPPIGVTHRRPSDAVLAAMTDAEAREYRAVGGMLRLTDMLLMGGDMAARLSVAMPDACAALWSGADAGDVIDAVS